MFAGLTVASVLLTIHVHVDSISLKNLFQAEVQSLKERLRKQKTSTNVATAEQVCYCYCLYV